jgi:hypothetical protein
MAAFGYCSRCREQHTIPTTEAAKKHARVLGETLESTGRLDFDSTKNSDNDNNPLLDVSCLHEIRGKMFGVLVTEDVSGNEVVLKSFAGKIRSYGWNLEGWVDSVVTPEDIPRFVELRDNVSSVTLEMDQAMNDAEQFAVLKSRRSQMSREALFVMRNAQRVSNFRGESASLSEIFLTGPGKMPVGTGECCATKLLAAATARNLRPTGIAEFFVGKSKNRRVDDGIFYDSCESRCQKVLGFMLCGMDRQY